MRFAFNENDTQAKNFSFVEDGHVSIQVLSGTGIWLSQVPEVTYGSQIDGSAIKSRDGFWITPNQGVVSIPWTGQVYLFREDGDGTVFGCVVLQGCQ